MKTESNRRQIKEKGSTVPHTKKKDEKKTLRTDENDDRRKKELACHLDELPEEEFGLVTVMKERQPLK